MTTPGCPGPSEPLRLRVFVDKSVVEVYANDRQAICRRVYPGRPDSLGVALFARGGEVEWRQRRGRLVRRETPVTGAAVEADFALRLTRSSFREIAPGLVEVRLVRRVAADNLLAVGGARSADREELRVEALQVAIRGARGGGW